MDAGLQRVIEEQRALPLPNMTLRDTHVLCADGVATALVGMRRAGKSYLLAQQMSSLLEQGVPRSSMLTLNLEDDRLSRPSIGLLDEALEHTFRSGPVRHEEKVYLFLDEIQVVPEWERFVLRVLNTENAQVFVTGSSAKLLSTEVATSLRGRSMAVEVLPFSFREFLRHRGLEPAGSDLGAAKRSLLEAAFDDYLTIGGFPGIQEMEPIDRTRMLQDYVELVTFRDVVERWEVANLVALKYLVGHLVSCFSREFSINRIYNDMKSQGIAIGKNTLHAYLEHLVDARLLHTVSIRRSSYRARQVNPRKVYSVDPGLAWAVAHPSADDRGHLLENAVYVELRRRHGRLHHDAISYFSSDDGGADFVLDDGNASPEIVQVSLSLAEQRTRERELRGAEAAMRETGAREATVVTLYESDTILVPAGTIRVVPAWRWMLEGA